MSYVQFKGCKTHSRRWQRYRHRAQDKNPPYLARILWLRPLPLVTCALRCGYVKIRSHALITLRNSPWRYGLLLAERSMKTDGVWTPCSRWWKRRSERGNIRQWTRQRNHQIESKRLPPLYSLVIWPLDQLVATVANSTHHAHVRPWNWWRTDVASSKEVEDVLCV